MAHLFIRLLGRFEASLDGEPASGFHSDKVRALLAYLCIEADRPHRRERLAGLLWPDLPEASARTNLRHALANLRRVISDSSESEGADTSAAFLSITRQTIQFNTGSEAWVDALAFLAALEATQRPIAKLEEAVGWYGGELLEGFSLVDSSIFEEWLLLQRERFQRLAVDALRRLAEGYTLQGEYDRALAYAWRQVSLEPLREGGHRLVMRLMAYGGRASEALAQYEACRRLLMEELSAEPSAETTHLVEQIRDGMLPLPPPSRVRLPAFIADEGPALAEPPIFVAREPELSRLGGLLDLALSGQGRVAFVVGEVGSGKTALMAEFAHRAMGAHRDLVVAGGECSAYSGFGDPYLPFRSILAMLSGDLQAHWSPGAIRLGHALRLQEAMPSTIQALLEHGPQVLDIFLQRESLLARASLAAHDGNLWLRRLLERLEQPKTRSERLDQSQLFQQTTNTLRALSGTHPLLLIVDDLQWADTASLGLLFHLGRRLQGSRILLLAACRPEGVDLWRGGERHPVQKLLAEFRRAYGDICLDLDRVEATGRAFIDALLDTEPNRLGEDFRSVLFKHTTGHPLFTIELLQAMEEGGQLFRDDAGRWAAGPALDWESLPARVEGAIEERLGRLDEELHDILAVACVQGEQFTAQVVARMLEIDERRLLRSLSQQLERRHRLVRWLGAEQVGEQRLILYQFAHSLFQQYLYASLNPGECQLLHRQSAAILEEIYQGNTDAIALQMARHYCEAGDDPRALRHLTLAADAALASYATDEAEICYRRAVELAYEDAHRAHLLEGLGRALARQSHFMEALQTWREAIELYRSLDDLESVARLYARSSYAAWWGDNLALSLRFSEEGLAAMASAPESPGMARLLHEAARAYYFGGFPEQAGSLCRRALEMAERQGAVDVQANALVTLGLLPGHAPQDALAWFTRAAQLAENANLLGIAFRARNNLAYVKDMIHGPQAGHDEMQCAAQLARRTGNVAQEIRALANLLLASLELGELEQAQGNLSRIRQLVADLDDPSSSGTRIRRLEAAVLFCQGEWVLAASLLQRCQAEARQQNDSQTLFNVDLLLARTLLEATTMGSGPAPCGWDEVERALTEAMDIGAAMGEADTNAWCRSYLVALYASQGHLEQANDLLFEARTLARDWPFPSVQAALLWAEARLSTAEGQWAEAVATLETLVEIYAQGGMRWDRARTLVDWAAAHGSRGRASDLSRARCLLEESHALFLEMGIPRYVELIQERLSVLPRHRA